MGLLSEIGASIVKSGRDIAENAKSYSKIVTINGQIAEEQRALSVFYSQIGEKYYALHRDQPEAELGPLCDRATAGLMRIAELQADVQRIKNSRLCPNCGAVCKIGSQFCSACGAKLPETRTQEAEGGINGDQAPEDDANAPQ